MKLHELLDSAYEYKITIDASNAFWAKFNAGEDSIDVDIDLYHGAWDVAFTRNGDLEITGEGDAIKIFATVSQILKDFIKKKNPKFISFSAKSDEASRVKLYRRMAKKIEASGFQDISDADPEDYPEVKSLIRQAALQTTSVNFLFTRK